MNLISLHLHLLLFFSFANCSHLPYREILSLKAFHREKTATDLEKAYIVQGIIWLFGHSDDSAQVLLRDTILDSVIEEEGEVVRQGIAYSTMVKRKSEGMINSFYRKENDGLELSVELDLLFQGTSGLASVKQFMANASKDHFSIASCKDKSVKRWQMVAMSEAATAWKQFSSYYEFFLSKTKFTKTLNSKSLQNNIGERMNMYLDSYERFLKPVVNQFDLGYSYAKILTTFYFFQYLHQISRIYAVHVTSDHINRLKRSHMEFIEDTGVFVSTITLQRTVIGSIPFSGIWMYDSKVENGILVPNKFKTVAMAAQYKTHKPLLRVSLYRVDLKHEQNSKSLLEYIRFSSNDEKCLELLIQTTQTDWDELWLGNLVRKLNNRLSTQDDITEMIFS